jgi:ADP-heptose:LPS heptosyltransferase
LPDHGSALHLATPRMADPFSPHLVRRIAVVRIGKIGDMIVANFAFRKIRATFPDARILLITLPRNKELLRYNTTADHFRYFHRGADILPLLLRLRSFRPDLLLDFNDSPSTTSAMLARFGGARWTVGFAFPANREYLSHPVECPSKERTHISERLRLIPEAVGMRFASEEVVPSMDLGPDEAAHARESLAPLRRPGMRIIAVNLSAGHPSRYWQMEKWRHFLKKIAADDPTAAFAFLTAPGDEALAREAETILPVERRIVPSPAGFQAFAALIAAADLLISPDTSAVHIASAFRVPVLGLYPAVEWNLVSWRPLATIAEVVYPREGVVSDVTVEDALGGYDRLTHRHM